MVDVIDNLRIDRGAARRSVPPLLRSACPLLVVFNFAMIPAVYFDHAWLFDANGRFTPS
jgi:hypothetical protein